MAGALRRFLSGALVLRAVVTELRGIRQQLTRQTDLLEQWSLKYGVMPRATVEAHANAADLSDSGVSFVDGIEQQIAAEYRARVEKDSGRAPTDEEILVYLADEKTLDLHARLKEREQLLDLEMLDRTGNSGRWSPQR